MHHCIADFKRFKEGTAERNLFWNKTKIFSFFLADTDARSSSWKIVVASKRPLILKRIVW